MKKRKGREPTLFDMLDAVILDFVAKRKTVTITEIRKKTGLAHPNLITHMKRLVSVDLIKRKKIRTTIYISLSQNGKKLYKTFFKPAYQEGLKKKKKKLPMLITN